MRRPYHWDELGRSGEQKRKRKRPRGRCESYRNMFMGFIRQILGEQNLKSAEMKKRFLPALDLVLYII